VDEKSTGGQIRNARGSGPGKGFAGENWGGGLKGIQDESLPHYSGGERGLRRVRSRKRG